MFWYDTSIDTIEQSKEVQSSSLPV